MKGWLQKTKTSSRFSGGKRTRKKRACSAGEDGLSKKRKTRTPHHLTADSLVFIGRVVSAHLKSGEKEKNYLALQVFTCQGGKWRWWAVRSWKVVRGGGLQEGVGLETEKKNGEEKERDVKGDTVSPGTGRQDPERAKEEFALYLGKTQRRKERSLLTCRGEKRKQCLWALPGRFGHLLLDDRKKVDHAKKKPRSAVAVVLSSSPGRRKEPIPTTKKRDSG